MSLPYAELHQQALPYKPESLIKSTSTWVAILLHTVREAAEIKSKHSWIWFKCNPRITVRTLKHEYFSRHPLDAFEFKFDHNFISDMVQVKDIRRDAPIASQVVVLRAFEDEHVDAEEDLEEAMTNAEKEGQNNNVSDNEVQERNSTIQACEENHTSEGGTNDSDRSGSGQLQDVGNEVQNSQIEAKLEGQPANTCGRGTEGWVTDEPIQSSTAIVCQKRKREEDTDEAHFQPFCKRFREGWLDFESRLKELPPPHNAIDIDEQQACEFCDVQFFVKPFTVFGPGSNPLCHDCTVLKGFMTAEFDDLVMEEILEKFHRQETKKRRQNFHPHARLDHPEDSPQPPFKSTDWDSLEPEGFKIFQRRTQSIQSANNSHSNQDKEHFIAYGYDLDPESDKSTTNEGDDTVSYAEFIDFITYQEEEQELSVHQANSYCMELDNDGERTSDVSAAIDQANDFTNASASENEILENADNNDYNEVDSIKVISEETTSERSDHASACLLPHDSSTRAGEDYEDAWRAIIAAGEPIDVDDVDNDSSYESGSAPTSES